MPKPTAWECNATWPGAVCSLARWCHAWYVLAVSEREYTALLDAFTGAHLHSQLSLVSLSAVSLICFRFGRQFSNVAQAALGSQMAHGTLHRL